MTRDQAVTILTELSSQFGNDPWLVQGAGGNISVKTPDGVMVIKASGTALKSVTTTSGWVGVPFARVAEMVSGKPLSSPFDSSRDEWLATSIDAVTTTEILGAKASIETAMHAVLEDIVVHLHPVVSNALLCAEDGKALCSDLCRDMPFLWIDPLPPGFYLSQAIKSASESFGGCTPSVIFLASHGVIVHGKSPEMVKRQFIELLERTRAWLEKKGFRQGLWDVTGWEVEIAREDLFPDTVVFHKLARDLSKVAPRKQEGIIETFAASKLIREIHQRVGLKSRYLPQEICSYILNMSREHHRQAEAQKS